MTAANATTRRIRLALGTESDARAREEASEEAPSPPEQQTRLVVTRGDIEFVNVERGRVQIAITVTNAGADRSEPAPVLIEAAPFGAFVDWQWLAMAKVPPLEPGESTVLRAEAEQTFVEPLGWPDQVSPNQIVAAVGAGRDDLWNDATTRRSIRDTTRSQFLHRAGSDRGRARDFSQTLAAANDILARLLSGRGRRVSSAPRAPNLPPSPFDLLTGPNTHWAGNLNVFIGGKDVERHCANALRIEPGRRNVAMFFVGDGGDSDWYRFELVGLRPDWRAAIYDPFGARSLALGPRDGSEVEPGVWKCLISRALLLLVIEPPAVCNEGSVEVHVTQRSTKKTAVVEFSFDPRASGPGCYVVA